ncbi:MAG: methylmalonyl-CoA mutase family protein [Saprospiraceae bacterium]
MTLLHLYGEDPAYRPDIYGKIGNSGVSVSCLDDAKRLYSGFDLCNPRTSVSMTINGPAATIAAYFMNAAIDQQCELYIKEHGLEDKVEAKLKEVYDDKGLSRPVYRTDVPEGNNGSGLMLLGLTGDQVLPADVYQLESKSFEFGSRNGTSRYFKRRSGTEYLYFQYRVFFETDG